MIKKEGTFWEHYFFNVEFVLEHRVIATCHHFEAFFQLVAVKLGEHAAMGDMVRRNFSVEVPIIVIPEGRVERSSIQERETVNTLQNRSIKIINLSKNFSHSASGILRVFNTSFSDADDILRVFQDISDSLLGIHSLLFKLVCCPLLELI